MSQPFLLGGNTWVHGRVEVCFDSGFSTAEQAAIRTMAENSWEKAAKINFHGWGACPALDAQTSDVLVLRVEDLGGAPGRTSFCSDGSVESCRQGFGRAPDGDYNLVRFPTGSPTQRALLHELGHVMGFLDEAEPATVCNRPIPSKVLNEVDPESVMLASATSATNLSAWDILGARRAYGTHAPGAIVGTNGICANLEGGWPTPGANIVGWGCFSLDWNSLWLREEHSLLLKATFGNASQCLNINLGAPGAGFTKLIAMDCDEGWPNELFHFSAVEWRAMGNWCIQAESNAPGARLWLERCNGSPLQKWDFFEGDRRIRLSGSDQCVSVPKGIAADQTQLVVSTCGTDAPLPNELFEFSEAKILFGGKALNVGGGVIESGRPLILYPPSSGSPYHNERFSIAGPITIMGPYCVDPETSSPLDGTRIGVRNCNSALAPSWEYFW